MLYDPLALEADPYPVYRRLRAQAPLYYGSADGRPFWALARYADIRAAVTDWQTFSSASGNDLDDTGELFGDKPAMDLADPPVHTRQREILREAMKASNVQQRLAPAISSKIDALLCQLREQQTPDVAQQLAYTLPMETICGWLGYPASDFAMLRGWHDAMLERVPGKAELPPSAIAARDDMWRYIRAAIDDRKVRPRDDLLTVLAIAERAGRLDPGEALANAVFLFDAGIVSTSALISSALLHLHDFPSEREKLWRDPRLISAAIEEFLRFDPPFQWFTRVTMRDVELHGQTIPEGARVILVWASGNRDETIWPDGELLRLDRRRHQHFSFSGGIHLCIGAPLARLEMRMLFERLIAQLVDYEIVATVRRRITPSERTISSLVLKPRWRN